MLVTKEPPSVFLRCEFIRIILDCFFAANSASLAERARQSLADCSLRGAAHLSGEAADTGIEIHASQRATKAHYERGLRRIRSGRRSNARRAELCLTEEEVGKSLKPA